MSRHEIARPIVLPTAAAWSRRPMAIFGEIQSDPVWLGPALVLRVIQLDLLSLITYSLDHFAQLPRGAVHLSRFSCSLPPDTSYRVAMLAMAS